MITKKGKLIFEDGTIFEGLSFGSSNSTSGEVVFATGMVGYPESITDPSYRGQILVFTYPLIGNYGVADKKFFESSHIHVKGIVVCNYVNSPSHHTSRRTLSEWLRDENIPGLEIADTRFITQRLRTKGTMLGKIIFEKDIEQYDPNKENLVAEVSVKKIIKQGNGNKKIVLFDCGAKRNITRSLLKRDVEVITVPWNYDVFDQKARGLEFDGIVISNGPGDPKMIIKTIEIIKKALSKKVPIFGICLGNQILALAAGGDTYKLKYGHRSQNQPCLLEGTKRCYITTQNHGFAVGKIPLGFKPWFTNANDGTNEGIIHNFLPFMSVQFHPESYPGPQDTDFLFDTFLKRI